MAREEHREVNKSYMDGVVRWYFLLWFQCTSVLPTLISLKTQKLQHVVTFEECGTPS